MAWRENGPGSCCQGWLFVLCMLLASLHCVTSIKCHQCESFNNSNCTDGPFDDFLVECHVDSTGCVKMKMSVLKFYESLYDQVKVNITKKDGSIEEVEKLKFTEYRLVKNADRVVRYCATDRPDKPYKKNCVFSTSLGGDVYFWTCYCSEKGCNGSDGVASTASMVLFFAAGWLWWCLIERDGVIP